jgi:hypothetical protein
MSKVARAPKPTLRSLAVEVDHLRERVEDLEDVLELETAIRKNGNRPLIPLDRVKRELDLE